MVLLQQRHRQGTHALQPACSDRFLVLKRHHICTSDTGVLFAIGE
jgi:hypothetical protein